MGKREELDGIPHKKGKPRRQSDGNRERASQSHPEKNLLEGGEGGKTKARNEKE